MKKIIVIGCPGSGKSTFSRELHERTRIPLYHLDMLFWNADKTTVEKSVFLELLGNSKIGNIEFRRIEENPHLRFDELLQILDGSNLGDEDYRTMLAVATSRRQHRS